MTENKVLVKEIQIDKGVFPIRSKTGKMSASESYKEQFLSNGLPTNAPKEFREAIPDLYYVARESELIEYNKVHSEISHEKDSIISNNPNPSDEDKRKALIEGSKKVLKNYGINDKTHIIYSPQVSKKLEEQDEFCKITATYNHEEKTLFVKTELLPRERNTPKEIVIGAINDIDLTEVKGAQIKEQEPEAKKVDLDEIKKKYSFQKPKVESISSILKRNSGQTQENNKEENKSPEEQEKDNIKKLISNILQGTWKDNTFTINYQEAGYLVPIEKVEILGSVIKLKSSAITNTEFWTKFTPIHECPRFEGALYIPDEYAPFCQQTKCNTACGADEGFVELSAARFRLNEESEIIKNKFQRLQQYLERCYSLMDEFQGLFGVDIKLDISTTKPYFYSEIYSPFEENILQNYIESYKTLYPEITDIRGRIDIESFILEEDYDPLSEAGLVQESRMYNLQEMVRLASKDILTQAIKNKDGEIDGNFYLIDHGRLRYLLKTNTIEAYREELYMGNVSFKKGINEVQNFVTTTLGGGRW